MSVEGNRLEIDKLRQGQDSTLSGIIGRVGTTEVGIRPLVCILLTF